MLRGGVASRGQRGLLVSALLATPACGFIVGFESREFCDDCSSASGAGGADAGAGGTDTSAGGADLNGANTGGTASGALASSSSGGSGGGDSGGTTGSGGSDTASGSGGMSGTGGAGSGGSGGGTETASGSGGTNTNGSGGAGGGGTGGGTETASGSGGTNTSGSGGATTGSIGDTGGGAGNTDTTTATTTSSVGGSTSVGGSGGSGGTGGATSPCTVGEPFDASETVGVYPSQLMLGRGTVRPWDLTWVENNDVHFAAYYSNGSEAVPPTTIDDSGTHSASVVITQDQYAHVAYGEFAAGDARVVMNLVNVQNPLEAEDVVQDSTEPLDVETAPNVMGIVLNGVSSDALVAAIDEQGAGVLALFSGEEFIDSVSLTGPLAAVAPLDLGANFGLAFIQDDTLQVALVAHDLDPIETPQPIGDAVPATTSERSLMATSLEDGAALVWVQSNGIYLTTVDDSGVAADPVQVSYGDNHILPMVDALGSQLVVSWIDADTHALYLRRFPTGLTDTSEAAMLVMEGVAETRYGFAADRFTLKPATFGFVVATNRLEMVFVACPGG